jgi:hypothetical protein
MPEKTCDYHGAVAFEVACASGAVRVELSGWDRLFTWRRSLVVGLAIVHSAFIESHGALEADIDHRATGFGAHNGAKRPGRRRVGAMLGRGVPGRQFWAVSAGAMTTHLLVLESESGAYARVVLEAGADVQPYVIAAVSAN